MVRDTLPSQDASTHQFEIPTSKNIGDMHRTRSGTDGRTDRRTDSAITNASQSSFWGIKIKLWDCLHGRLSTTFIQIYNLLLSNSALTSTCNGTQMTLTWSS